MQYKMKVNGIWVPKTDMALKNPMVIIEWQENKHW